MMDVREYTQEALRTWNPSGDMLRDNAYLAGKLSCESNEVLQLILKWMQHGKNYTAEEFSDEMGDVLWYFTTLLHVHGLHLETVMERNIAKLRERHPTGDTSAFYQGD